MAASRLSSRRATWSFCTRSVVRVNRTRHPFSMRAKPIAAAKWLLPPPGGPNRSRLAPLPSQPSPAASAVTCALEIIGTASKSKLSKVFPAGSRASTRWRSTRRRPRSAISCSAMAARKRAAGVAKGELTGRMVGARVAELEAEIDRQEARLARATEANFVTLHPATIAVYLDAVEQLAKALSAADAKAACIK